VTNPESHTAFREQRSHFQVNFKVNFQLRLSTAGWLLKSL